MVSSLLHKKVVAFNFNKSIHTLSLQTILTRIQLQSRRKGITDLHNAKYRSLLTIYNLIFFPRKINSETCPENLNEALKLNRANSTTFNVSCNVSAFALD